MPKVPFSIGHPDRAPQTDEDSVLKREDAPRDDACGEEADSRDHAAELGVGGAPVADGEQEQNRDDHRRPPS